MGQTIAMTKYRVTVMSPEHQVRFQSDWLDSYIAAESLLQVKLLDESLAGWYGRVESYMVRGQQPDPPKPETMSFLEAAGKLKDGASAIKRLCPDWTFKSLVVHVADDGRMRIMARNGDDLLNDYYWVPTMESLTADDWVVAG